MTPSPSTDYLAVLWAVAPEAVLLLTALVVIGAGFFSGRELGPNYNRWINVVIALAGSALAFVWVLLMDVHTQLPGGMLSMSPIVAAAKAALIALAAATLVLSAGTSFTDHFSEYCALVLIATVGMLLLVSAADLLMIFLALELTSICLYVLVGFDKHRPTASEAALKYFLVGGISAACTLFGISLLYGISGSTRLDAVAAGLERAFTSGGIDPLAAVAIVLASAGFAFKVAAAPFHLWAPDVYRGAPVPSAALIASGSKVAGFLVLARLVWAGVEPGQGSAALGDAAHAGVASGWTPLIALIAAASMILGNLAALVQRSLRRLIAYSAIAHGGYALLGVMAGEGQGGPALFYYVVTYGIAALGAFGLVHLLEEAGVPDEIASLAGLGKRAPVLSACLLVFMLSLAGIPPLAGFLGKFFVFSAALQPIVARPLMLWLVILALGTSAVSLYYYLTVLKQVYVVPERAPIHVERLRPSLLSGAVVLVLAIATILLGCCPGILIEHLIRFSSSH
jgi:NADH-quinone oxidoreductase subunit N